MKTKVKSNKTLRELRDSDKRISIFQGGSRSGKSYNIVLFLVLKALKDWDNKVITICRSTMPSLKGSILRDFLEILDRLGAYDPYKYNKTEHIYLLRNNLFEFISIDQPQKIRGRKRNVLFINEANEIDFESWVQLSLRTTEKIILDYNPSMIDHWIYDQVLTRDDSDFYQSTYKDNPFLDAATINEIERLQSIDNNYWLIYGLGERGMLRGLIFDHCKQVDSMPSQLKNEARGLDFGFTNDVTAMIHCGVSEGEIYLDEEIYETGLTNIINPKAEHQKSIEQRLEGLGIKKNDEVYADSAEPKSIRDLRNCNYLVLPTKKGKDSIVNGIDVIRRYPINITARSVNLWKEARNYKWQEVDGKQINKPVDAFNHAWDAVRYWALAKINNKQRIYRG